MNKNHQRIYRVIDSIATRENASLIESIRTAAQICFEGIPQRDLGYQPMTAAMPMQLNLGRVGRHQMGQGALGDADEGLEDDIDVIEEPGFDDEEEGPELIEDQSEIGKLIAALKEVQAGGEVEDVVSALALALEQLEGGDDDLDDDDDEFGVEEECGMGY